MSVNFTQEKFDRTLRTYLDRLSADKIPNALNKKALRVAYKTLAETPRTNPFKILYELKTPVMLKREDGSSSTAPIGYALAAKRASKGWSAQRGKLATRKRKANLTHEWQKAVTKAFNSMVGRRRAATGFIKAGWVSVIRALSPLVKGGGVGGSRSDFRTLRGSMKGTAKPARAGWSPSVTIENTASAKSDKRNGLIKYGEPALERAFAAETADMVKYLEDEAMKEETEKFNAAQR